VLRFGNIALLVSYLAASAAADDDVRYYQQNGVTYRETRTVVKQPVNDVQYRDMQKTFYRDRYTTEMRDVVRNSYVPVMRHAWQPRWHGQWNILHGPHLAYHLVPYTSWEVRQQTIQVPTTRREVVPETRTVRVPQTNLRYEDRVQVTRVPVGPSATHGSSRAAQPPAHVFRRPTQNVDQREMYGGIARLDGDPPRYGIATKSEN
jgi:hypothetical protein